MAIAYPLLYRFGLHWWQDNDDTGPLPALIASRPPGRALDAGCGTGRHALWLAEQGWTVIGVDSVEQPLREARTRAHTRGLADRATFIKDDVAHPRTIPTSPPFDLVVDIGCYHGLRADQQRAFAAWVSRNTSSDAAVVIHAVAPRSGVGPKGIDEARLAARFGPGWAITTTPSTTTGGGPLRTATFRWFTLTRSTTPTGTPEQARP